MKNAEKRIFLDPRADDDALLGAVSLLMPRDVPSSFWTQVANDPSYRLFHRVVAVREVFRRYVTVPMLLSDVARLLDGARWLPHALVEEIKTMGGEIPVGIPAGGAAFVIGFPQAPGAEHPSMGLYLVLDRELDAGTLGNVLMLQALDASVGQIRIVGFSFFPEILSVTVYP